MKEKGISVASHQTNSYWKKKKTLNENIVQQIKFKLIKNIISSYGASKFYEIMTNTFVVDMISPVNVKIMMHLFKIVSILWKIAREICEIS